MDQNQQTIQRLATQTAELARARGVKPNVVVRMVCREYGLPEDLATDILRECGRRCGKSAHGNKRIKKETQDAIIAEYRRLQFEKEMQLHLEQANEHICPVND